MKCKTHNCNYEWRTTDKGTKVFECPQCRRERYPNRVVKLSAPRPRMTFDEIARGIEEGE